MWIALFSVLVATICVAASARRLLFVHEATRYDVARLVEELRGDAGALRGERVSAGLAKEDCWEGAVVRALGQDDPRVRVAELNEQLADLDYELSRWSRVPRVCASLSSSIGFLLAALTLRQGLSDPTALSGDVSELVTVGLVGQALTVVGLGLGGAVACAALKARGDRAARLGSEAADDFVERLETLGQRSRAGDVATTSDAG